MMNLIRGVPRAGLISFTVLHLFLTLLADSVLPLFDLALHLS